MLKSRKEVYKMKWFTTILMLALLLGTAWASDRGLVYHEVQFVDETGAPVTDVCSINIYLPDSTTNATIYMDRGLSNAITQSIRTDSTNTTFSQSLGTLYWWGPDGYDYTFTNGTNIATNAGHRTRSSSEGRLYFPSYLTNITSADYEDGESVSYGSDDDFIVQGGLVANRLTFTPIANDSAVWIGTTGLVSDLLLWGDTAGYDLMWDASDNRLEFDDDAILGIGNAPDWYIVHSGGTTTATGALTHASAATFSTDVTLTGNAYNVEWDNSSDTLHLLDGAELGLGGATTADGDVVFKHDGTDFTLTTIRASEPFKIGGTTNGFDITYYFATAGTLGIDHDGDILAMSDDMFIGWGNTSADPDIKIEWDTGGTDALLIEGKTADTEIKIGYTTNLNLGIYGATNSAYVLFDTDSGAYRAIYEGFDQRFMDDDILEFGDSAEVTMNYDEDGDDDLQIVGAVDLQTTWYQFRSAPACANDAGGGVATGTAGDENRAICEDAAFEYHVIGTVTTAWPTLGGTLAAGGWDIQNDAANDEGLEFTQGITARCKHALVAQTDSGFFEVKIYITDVTGTDDLAVGWRLAEAYQANLDDYRDFYCLNVISGSVFIESDIDGGGTDSDDTSIDTADTTAVTLKVVVASDGTVKSYVNGTEETEHQTEFTFTSADVIVPFVYFLHDSDVAENTYLMHWRCQKD